jgi:hypothetical protein
MSGSIRRTRWRGSKPKQDPGRLHGLVHDLLDAAAGRLEQRAHARVAPATAQLGVRSPTVPNSLPAEQDQGAVDGAQQGSEQPILMEQAVEPVSPVNAALISCDGGRTDLWNRRGAVAFAVRRSRR